MGVLSSLVFEAVGSVIIKGMIRLGFIVLGRFIIIVGVVVGDDCSLDYCNIVFVDII